MHPADGIASVRERRHCCAEPRTETEMEVPDTRQRRRGAQKLPVQARMPNMQTAELLHPAAYSCVDDSGSQAF